MRPVITGVVGLENVPDPISSLCTLERVDYVDLFTLHAAAAGNWPAE
jgi:hypothetical protein